jgi:hypothetical protein
MPTGLIVLHVFGADGKELRRRPGALWADYQVTEKEHVVTFAAFRDCERDHEPPPAGKLRRDQG